MIQLKVNGVARSFDGDPEMPLLWYLRDILGLTGTKFGCGIALCGACTVHKNGEALRACITPMSSSQEPKSGRSKISPLTDRTPCKRCGCSSMSHNAATASQDRLCRRSPY